LMQMETRSWKNADGTVSEPAPYSAPQRSRSGSGGGFTRSGFSGGRSGGRPQGGNSGRPAGRRTGSSTRGR